MFVWEGPGSDMTRALAWVCLAVLGALVAMQLSTEKAYRHWLYLGFETAALLACFAATL
jgi:hypothetical protein